MIDPQLPQSQPQTSYLPPSTAENTQGWHAHLNLTF